MAHFAANANPAAAPEHNAAQALTWRYAVALVLVASLSTAAWLSLHWVISSQESTAAVVNVSGRQRMLSQRSALFATQLVNAPAAERPTIRASLAQAVDLFEKSHHGLTQGDTSQGLPPEMSSAVRALYFDGPQALDAQVRAYVAALRALLSQDDLALDRSGTQLQAITRTATGPLLSTLDQMVQQYQREGEANIAWLVRAESFFWLLTLLLLALEALLIFRPFAKHIQHMIAQLQATSQQLQQHQASLESLVEQRTQQLAESEEKFRLIAAAAQDAILIIDAQDHLVYWNPAAQAMFGYTPDELAQVRVHALLAPANVQTLAAKGLAAFQLSGQGSRVGQRFETLAVRQGGVEFPIEMSFSAVQLRNGWHGVGMARDITERKRLDTELRIAATAFESQLGMVITNAKQTILRVNKAFTSITGYSASDVVGQTPRLLSSGRHDHTFYADMFASLAEHGGWQGEIWNRHKNGEVFPEWLTITTVKNEAGEITHYVAAFNDISERKAAENQIKTLAFYDPLTELPNRRLLMDRLAQALAAALRHQRVGALLFIDLDNFKNINDSLGHLQGDLLLCQAARRLEACVREGDTVARLGGDEFVVMLERLAELDTEAATQAEVVGEKIFACLRQPYALAQQEVSSTPSIGITLFGGQQSSLDDIMKRADMAMYQAKAAGRNTLRFFDQRMQAVVDANMALEADLRHALAQQQFALHYQVQVTASGEAVGAEALVRWMHPQRGMVSPAEFIPMAEQTQLILPLGAWVLEAACHQVQQWSGHPQLGQLTLAVNVSPVQFRQAGFVAQVLDTLERTGANPKRIKLELTESLLLDNVAEVIGKMRALKTLGLDFSLDDFGTGYSSLAYLRSLPLDQLKIDQCFVQESEFSDSAVAICAATVSLGHNLRLKVVAEGVETQAQRHLLAEVHGCDLLQGYLFGRPMAAPAFEALVLSGQTQRIARGEDVNTSFSGL